MGLAEFRGSDAAKWNSIIFAPELVSVQKFRSRKSKRHFREVNLRSLAFALKCSLFRRKTQFFD